MKSDNEPLAIIEGCRLEIEGVEVLLVVIPFISEHSQEAANQLVAIQNQMPVIFVAKIGNRMSIVANDYWRSRISIEMLSGLKFSRIPIFAKT